MNELAKLLPAVQLISSEKANLYFYKLKVNNTVPLVDNIETQPNTHKLDISFNFIRKYWCVAKAIYHNGKRLLITFNSKLRYKIDQIETFVGSCI